MRISKANFQEGSQQMKGLKSINLSQKPLGALIALAGKNGSGKSRILNLIENYAHNLTVKALLENEILFTPPLGNNFMETLPHHIKKYNSADEAGKISIESQLQGQALDVCKKNIGAFIKRIDSTTLTTIVNSNEANDYETLNSNKLLASKQLDFLLTSSTINYLQKLSDQLNLDRYNSIILEENEKLEGKLEDKPSYVNFHRFQFYTERFLGKKISSKAKSISVGESFSSILLLNGQPFQPQLLSPGEKILLSFAILFYLMEIKSNISLENCILILDEPENHLHPSAQIKVIKAIKEIIKDKGQLWIATHSLPLLASLDYDEIFLVKNDELILPNRYNPGNSILELMESEENSFRIKEFLISSSGWAYSNFLIQCFLDPDVHFSSSQKDSQIFSLKEFIKSKSKLKILDFGAGKGRLAKAFEENESLHSKIDLYCALEPEKNLSEELKKNKFIKKVFTSDVLPKNQFDLVLLFNVLHEINPEKWIDIFSNIKDTLNEAGSLIIVEDKFLPKGEKIDKYGYLILNEYQILDLFAIKHEFYHEINQLNENKDNRITFSVIPRDLINISPESIMNAISNLRKEIYGKLEEIRKQENQNSSDISIGRKYAHFLQLHFNTILAEKYLPEYFAKVK